ncbi:MAG: aminotransferase class I/II-fold pyridoxal phosphate-dependent enzyme [Acidobacteria bacterium]|nr:aminotransferase class I/II-fold pyridoxal phosphate-dependent enzyme [Acidobacteriota bacterium]
MKIPTFDLERIQSLWENVVEINLSESGVHPLTLSELLDGDSDMLANILATPLGYPQTNGTPALRERIAALYPGSTPENVLATNGTSEANFVTLWSLLEPGDELVVMLPNYMQIWGLGRGFTGEVKPFHLRAEDGWSPDIDELRRQVTSRTRIIAVCNPNNPAGSVMNAEDMQAILDIAAEAGAWLVADEVYQGAEREGERTRSFWTLREHHDRMIITNGLSKAYGLPGLRMGWTLAPPEQAATLWSYRDYTTIAPSALSDKLAQAALEPARRERILARTRSILQRNYTVLAEWLDAHTQLFTHVAPKAGAIAWLRYHFDINSTQIVDRLRSECGVLIVPGDCFGMDRYLRIGFGGEVDAMREGLNRIGKFLNQNE